MCYLFTLYFLPQPIFFPEALCPLICTVLCMCLLNAFLTRTRLIAKCRELLGKLHRVKRLMEAGRGICRGKDGLFQTRERDGFVFSGAEIYLVACLSTGCLNRFHDKTKAKPSSIVKNMLSLSEEENGQGDIINCLIRYPSGRMSFVLNPNDKSTKTGGLADWEVDPGSGE